MVAVRCLSCVAASSKQIMLQCQVDASCVSQSRAVAAAAVFVLFDVLLLVRHSASRGALRWLLCLMLIRESKTCGRNVPGLCFRLLPAAKLGFYGAVVQACTALHAYRGVGLREMLVVALRHFQQ